IRRLFFHLPLHLLPQRFQYFYLNSWTSPPKIVCSTVNSLSNTNISESFPAFKSPLFSKPNSLAWLTELILTASSMLHPENLIIFLQASLNINTDPANEPLSKRACLSFTITFCPPSSLSPSGLPFALIESVINTIPSAPLVL